MKRFLALLMAIVMISVLSACGKENTINDKSSNVSQLESTNHQTSDENSNKTETGIQESESTGDKETTTTSDTQVPNETNKPTEGNTDPSHSHNYTAKVTKAATCSENGTKTFTCSCGAIYNEKIEVTGHVFDNNEDTTCNKCGYTRSLNCTHSKTKVLNGHAATCEGKGLTDGKICASCDKILVKQTVINALGHAEGKWVVDKAATVTSAGTKHLKCALCGKKLKEETIPATGSVGLKITVNTDGKTCTIAGIGSCKDKDIYISNYIDGYKVSAIGDNAFSGCASITSVNIPDVVTTIGARAFYGCTGLSEITIPKTITNIGSQIFYKSGIKTVYYNSEATTDNGKNVFLNEPTIEKVVFGGTRVPKYICYGCTNLKSVTILDTVNYINSNAFRDCSNLNSVSMGKGVTYIANCSFYGCTKLESIQIPKSVTTLFQPFGSSGIKSIYFLGELTDWINMKKYNLWIDGSYDLYIKGSKLETLILDDTYTSILGVTFYHASIKSVVIPDSVKLIEESAFKGCKSLTTIYYLGSPESWNSINNKCTEVKNATRYYYSEVQPTQSGNYWHYVNGIPTAW